MPDNDGNVFSAALEELKRGGVDFEHLGTLMTTIYGDLYNVINKYGQDLGGNGDIGKSIKANYFPAAQDSLSFLKNLSDLFDVHGNKTSGLSDLFADMNDSSTIEAGGVHGNRH